ncbi:MAG TPA: SPOR domain-containing protein [Blastocatellia bacterium]
MESYDEPEQKGSRKKWLVIGLLGVIVAVCAVLGYQFQRWRGLLPGFHPTATNAGAPGHTPLQQSPRQPTAAAAPQNPKPAVAQSSSPAQQRPMAVAQQSPTSAAVHNSPAPAQTATPAAQHTEPSVGQALPSNGTISFQISSFPGQAGAEEMSRKLSGIGIPAYVVAADIPHRGKWFRVRAGRFTTMQQAEGAAAEWRQRAAKAGISLQQMITCDYQNP